MWVNPLCRNKWGETALHVAAENGHAKVTSWLLEDGVDPNTSNNDHQTALFLVADKRHDQVVSILLDKGANPKIQEKYGGVALHAAV
jgi:ankyrin repeat protein